MKSESPDKIICLSSYYMNTFKDLYSFIDFAKNNRKYAVSTANNLKSALKIFERELTPNELTAIDIVEQNIEEIFVTVINKNKDKDVNSLSTYRARLLKVISDYKKYGKNPSKIQNWIVRHRTVPQQSTALLKTKDNNSTALGKTIDKQDKNKITLSDNILTPVETVNNCHKIELAFASGKATIFIPNNITSNEIKLLKNILDSLN